MGAKAIDTLAAKVVVPVSVGLAAFLAGRNLGAKNAVQALKYSLGWVVIGVVFDIIGTVLFTGWQIFTQWNVWLGYFLVLTMPVAATEFYLKTGKEDKK